VNCLAKIKKQEWSGLQMPIPTQVGIRQLLDRNAFNNADIDALRSSSSGEILSQKYLHISDL
jgi:hypothetical protein